MANIARPVDGDYDLTRLSGGLRETVCRVVRLWHLMKANTTNGLNPFRNPCGKALSQLQIASGGDLGACICDVFGRAGRCYDAPWKIS